MFLPRTYVTWTDDEITGEVSTWIGSCSACSWTVELPTSPVTRRADFGKLYELRQEHRKLAHAKSDLVDGTGSDV